MSEAQHRNQDGCSLNDITSVIPKLFLKVVCALELNSVTDFFFLPLLFQMGMHFLKKNTALFPSHKLFDPMIQPKGEQK